MCVLADCAFCARVELSHCDEAEDGEEERKSLSQPHSAPGGAHTLTATTQQHLQARTQHTITAEEGGGVYI